MTWPDAGSAGPVVLLAVGPLVRRSGWAAKTAVELAERLAEDGANVVLADLSLNNPELHALLGIDNDEGLTDVFVFGASLQHVIHTIPGKRFRLIPASAFTPDPATVLTHARWGGLFEELATTQTKLLVYLPVDTDGARAFSDRVGQTIILADRDEVESVRQKLSADADVVDVRGPGFSADTDAETRTETETGTATETETETGQDQGTGTAERVLSRDEEFEKIRIPKDSARDALIADLRARQRAALMAPPPPIAPLPEEGAALVRPLSAARPAGAPAPPIFRLRAMHPAPARPTRWFSWLLALLVVSALAGLWHYRSTMTDWWGRRRSTARMTAAAPVSTTARPPARNLLPAPGVKLPYSVALASYQVMSLADEQIRNLSRTEKDVSFYIAPVVVQGTLFFQVMAGPLADSASAAALRDTLIARKIKNIATPRDVLATPLAYLLGEYATRGEAESQQKLAMRKGVPAYIVDAANTSGDTQYKVYAGAYTGPGDAEFMRPILKAAGLPDNLVERTGSIRT